MSRSRPYLLDLFCGAGGCSVGYRRAGFDVVGVDIEPHGDYPFDLIVADALEVDLDGYDAYHASPPCQFATAMSNRWRGKGTKADSHTNLIPAVRERLQATGKPYVIENVAGAKRFMRSPIELTGEMFGLRAHRPRLFESNVTLLAPARPPRQKDPVAVYGKNDGRRLWTRTDGSELHVADLGTAQEGLGIFWMDDWADLTEAVPPAYTEHVGAQLIEHARERAA